MTKKRAVSRAKKSASPAEAAITETSTTGPDTSKTSTAAAKAAKKPTARNYKRYVREKTVEHMEQIVGGLLTHATVGSSPHTKLLLEMGEMNSEAAKPSRRRGKSLAKLLIDELGKRNETEAAAPVAGPEPVPANGDGAQAAQ